jgi:hypothetical protein
MGKVVLSFRCATKQCNELEQNLQGEGSTAAFTRDRKIECSELPGKEIL